MSGQMQSWASFLLAALAAQAPLAAAFAEAGTEAGQCEFDNIPVGVGYYWDPTCKNGMLGCDADGINMECRFCGAKDFMNISCPASSCKFPNDPFVSYYWDNECEMGKLGCWADGIHAQCRFCGRYPFTGLPCPEGAAPPNAAACTFENDPGIPHYWEPGCEMGKAGCNADGINVHCRFCGAGVYSVIPCPAEQVCEFKQKPTVPYYWDPDCKDGMLGCKADGIHNECRFCATRPFEDIPCPEAVAPPEHTCTWPVLGEPLVPHFWDPTCAMGKAGCWADGIHAECRFCGQGAYQGVLCPNTTTTTDVPDDAIMQAGAGQTQAHQFDPENQSQQSGTEPAIASAENQSQQFDTEPPTASVAKADDPEGTRGVTHEDWSPEKETPVSGVSGISRAMALLSGIVASLARHA